MFRLIILLLILIPAIEIWVIFSVGRLIGGFETFILIIVTGVLGAYMAKRELAKVWGYVRNTMSSGQLPGASLIDAICVFVGGIMLLFPGFVTDALGLLLVIPVTRQLFRNAVLSALKRWIEARQYKKVY